MTVFSLVDRFGWTVDEVRAMRTRDVRELTRYLNWADKVKHG